MDEVKSNEDSTFFNVFKFSCVSQEIVNTLMHNTQLSEPSVKLLKRNTNVLVLPFLMIFQLPKDIQTLNFGMIMMPTLTPTYLMNQ